MTSDSSNHEPVPVDADEPELERWLNDAYQAPPLPPSLLRRIDAVVEAEWGQSPGLATSWVRRAAASARGRNWVRAASALSAVAATILFAVLITMNGPRYAWADVLEAIARQGVIQQGVLQQGIVQQGESRPTAAEKEDAKTVRWLSLSEAVLGERNANSARLLDLRQNIVLTRTEGENQVRRRAIGSVATADARDELLVGFLRGDSFESIRAGKLRDVRVVDERWERQRRDGRDEVRLLVHFEDAEKHRFTLRLTLDPASRLPFACEEVHGDRRQPSLALTYPAADVDALRQRDFPADLVVVDDAEPQFATSGPSASPNAASPANSAAQSDAQEAHPASTAAQPEDTASASLKQTDLLRAPSEWGPVAIVDRSPSDARAMLDELLTDLWSKHTIEPAAVASDEELMRRVYLDLAGRTPSVSEVRRYLNNPAGDRYEQLVDQLLSSPDHASHLATVWRTFLIPEGVDLTAFGGVEAFDRWLAERFAENAPYDDVVRDLLLAEGRLSRSGPLLFYSAVKLDADQLAARTARVFLGMRLECAQCHDHPFEPWSQQDFWSFAAYFAQISRPEAELETVSTLMQVRDVDHGEVTLPETETVAVPRLLNGAALPETLQQAVRRKQLAHWLTDRDNPYFARATANRVWAHLFGKGIVDPVDDFGTQHPPTSPELLDLLAGHFISSGFDLRELFRTVALSRAYRLSSAAATADERRMQWFAQMNVKMLTAEQVYDCIAVATLLDPAAGNDASAFQVARFGNDDRAAFIQQFRTLAGRSTEYQGGIPQALTLMNGTLIENATGLSSSGLLNSLEAPFFTNRERIEVLYMATLSRRPRLDEWELLDSYISADASGPALKEQLADLLWALLNSAEFTMNH